MKKLALTGIATLALAAGALAQGLVAIDDSANANGVAFPAGTYYSGPFGMEVWDLNSTTLPTGINNAATASDAYAMLATDKFTLEKTFAGQTMSVGGFSLGTVTLTAPSPAGSSVVLALAVWNSSDATWAAAGVAKQNGGVLAFVNPTIAPGAPNAPPPTPASLTGWTSGDLVMTAVTVP